jgi:hypothetical protein
MVKPSQSALEKLNTLPRLLLDWNVSTNDPKWGEIVDEITRIKVLVENIGGDRP